MKTGDTIRIHVHGEPESAAVEATVLFCSENQCSIAIQFQEAPPFSKRLVDTGALGIDRRNFKVTMLLGREMLEGRPWGPYVEIVGGGHYEIV